MHLINNNWQQSLNSYMFRHWGAILKDEWVSEWVSDSD